MTEARRTYLRNIMSLAWDLHRSEPSRPFGDCLSGAWAWTRRMAQTAAAMMAKARRNGGRLSFGSPVTSPIQRATSGQRYARVADWHAAGLTGRVGW